MPVARGQDRPRRRTVRMLWPLLSGAIGLALWEGWSGLSSSRSSSFPRHSQVIVTIVDQWWYLLSQLAITTLAAGLGLVIAVVFGLAAGAAITARGCRPHADALAGDCPCGPQGGHRAAVPGVVRLRAAERDVLRRGLHLLPGDREHGDGPEVGRPRADPHGARHGRTPTGPAQDPVPERPAQHLRRHQARRHAWRRSAP